MKRIIKFSKYFLPAAIFSTLLILFGLYGYFTMNFNLGIDFQSGLIQEVQFAPSALDLTYTGNSTVSVYLDRSKIDVVVSGASGDNVTHSFPYNQYKTIGDMVAGLSRIEGLKVSTNLSSGADSHYLIQSARGDSHLRATPYLFHYLAPGANVISIEDVRSSLISLGEVSVQVLGEPSDRKFMIRVEEKEVDGTTEQVPAELIISALEDNFGKGEVAVISSSYVGSRFSKNLTDQVGILMALTLLLILAYSSIRFKPQFALGAVIAILHDALVIVGFVVWTRMEFNTTTIAAILTILGYSINDTIVIFDRIRENRKLYPDDGFELTLNRSLSETLGRTIITTFTTLLAVFALYFFTTGSMKDFALALIVGMVSGVYSTIFIASGFVNFWDKHFKKKNKPAAAVPQTNEG